MPKRSPDIADVLAFSTVQAKIGALIEEAAKSSGINPQVGKRMAIGITERIAEGYPIQAAIDLVEAIQAASAPREVQ